MAGSPSTTSIACTAEARSDLQSPPLDFPEDQYDHRMQLTVRATDIKGAKHLGNDSMISEARVNSSWQKLAQLLLSQT